MTDPVLHVVAGPNGAGKTTLYERVIGPSTRLPFVNAHRIAAQRWPGQELEHAYDAAAAAADERARLLARRRSFVTETVFSHVSKVELLREARTAGYLITLHVVLVPVELAVLRVQARVAQGGHAVPEHKIRDRRARLWDHLAAAAPLADELIVYDNTVARRPLRTVAHLRGRQPVMRFAWPDWTPPALRALEG